MGDNITTEESNKKIRKQDARELQRKRESTSIRKGRLKNESLSPLRSGTEIK